MSDVMRELYQTVASRKEQSDANSYTGYLFAQGLDKICKKLGEESAETIIAAKNGEHAPLVGEAADLLFHLMVLLCERGVAWDDVREELENRSRKTGNKKVMREVDKNT